MNKIKFCTNCLYSNLHPLGLTFNEAGVCSGCQVHKEKNYLNWEERKNKLLKKIKSYKTKKSNNYDCIIPVNGAYDSYYTVHLAKNILGLHPLLVSNNNYYNSPLGIKNLANLRIKFDCDILFKNPNPISVKKITKFTLQDLGNVYWHSIAGQTAFPVQTAINYKIPLIIWGAHQGVEQVGMFSHTHEVEMTRRHRKDHDLMGIEAEDLINVANTSLLNESDIFQYIYPSDDHINSIGVIGIYLSNYFRWDPKKQHELMIKKFDYQTCKFNRTFDCYDFVDSYVYMEIHDLLKFYKHGYSKVTDHVCREIRHKRISRSKGIDLVKKYEHEEIKYVDSFCKWLGINEKSLKYVLNRNRNPKFWKEYEPNNWKYKGLSSLIKKNNYLRNKVKNISYICNSKIDLGKKSEFITVGKGYNN